MTRKVQGATRIDIRQRLGGVPVHERQVVIVSVLLVSDELADDQPALVNRQPLQRGGDVEADYGGRVVLCDLLEFGEKLGILTILDRQLKGPGTDIRARVFKYLAEHSTRRPVHD